MATPSTSKNAPLLRALGTRVRELRLAAGYSQESFADACGLHRTYMGALERGESNVSFQNMAKVAVTLRITLSQLLDGIEKRVAANHAEMAASSVQKFKGTLA